MKNLLRDWLVKDDLNRIERRRIDDIETTSKALDQMYNRQSEMKQEIRELAHKVLDIETSLKLPVQHRLTQVRKGLDILAAFANEIQSDIDRGAKG